MEITNVKVRKFEKENSRMKGMATVTLDNEFVVLDIRILQGDEKMFIAMPSRRKPNGDFIDIAHPITQETREKFEKAIFDEYEKAEVYVPYNESDETEEE